MPVERRSAVLALALPIVVLFFVAGFMSQRRPVPRATTELEALHAGLGVDMTPGATAPLAAPDAAVPPPVGPVSELFTQSLDSLRLVVEQEPSDPAASLALAELLQDAHREAEAVLHFERALSVDPSNRQAWLDLADSYGAQQQWDAVQSAMTRMLTAHPDDPSAAYNMGVAFANSGDYESARRWWTAAMEQQRDPQVSVLAEASLARIAG